MSKNPKVVENSEGLRTTPSIIAYTKNEEVLVEHRIVTYGSGDREALMLVHLKKDGLLWRTETGATPLKATN